MPLSATTVESQALSLQAQARTHLVLKLLDSIDPRPQEAGSEVQAAWIAEADRRFNAYLRGAEEAIPAEQVFADLARDAH